MTQPVQQTGGNAAAVTTPIVPRDFQGRVTWINNNKMGANRFAIASRRATHVPDINENNLSGKLEKTTQVLDVLENDTQMSPQLNRSAGIEVWLAMFNDPQFHFPDDIKQRAAMLLQRFQDENWGAPPPAPAADSPSGSDSHEETASPSTPAASSARATPAARANIPAVAMRPPADDEIWGKDGIMHDMIPKVSEAKIRSLSIDPDYKDRRSAKVLGHNGLEVGAWSAYRLCALRDGAHGESQAGISGNIQDGAWSIVLSGVYEGVDEDFGDTIWYSAPGSADNKNRNEAAKSSGTGWIQRSLTTGNPVRVLRAANKKSGYAPSVGIRYDGLYDVVEQNTGRNDKGGLFIRYRLKRRPGQKPLKDVMRDSPTAKQMADYRRIKDLW